MSVLDDARAAAQAQIEPLVMLRAAVVVEYDTRLADIDAQIAALQQVLDDIDAFNAFTKNPTPPVVVVSS